MNKSVYIILSLAMFFPLILWAEENMYISSVSSDFISVVNRSQTNTTTIALYGDNFTDVIYNDDYKIYLYDLEGYDVAGNDQEINVTFAFAENELTGGEYRLRIKHLDEILFESEFTIEIFNPYDEQYSKPRLNKFFDKAKHKKATKKRVGLNVHQSTAASSEQDNSSYIKHLQNSKTKWVREHFSHQLIMGASKSNWVTRYDKIMKQYKDNNIRVVGMLAYDKNQDYTDVSIGAWRKYVRYTVRRYRNYVDVWEIWNEPDSDSYLHPSNMNGYYPLLKSASKIIKTYDHNSIVLNGAVADITNLKFVDSLYRRGSKYFDAFNMHLYYCDSYQFNGNNGLQKNDIENLEKVIFKDNRSKKVWVTEIGCSTYDVKYNQNTQKDYLKKSVNYLLKKNYIENVLLYTFRDRDLEDEYEANFGLTFLDHTNKKAWQWYRKLPKK